MVNYQFLVLVLLSLHLKTNIMKQQILLNAIILAISFFPIHQLLGQTFTTPSIDGVPITYEVRGKGALALVFVHGWSCDRSYWKGQLEPFSHRYKVVAIDLAGHGESGTERKNYTIKSFGADVATVITKLNLQQVILVGHSMGGDVIAAAARLLPHDHIKGLVMVDTYKHLGSGRTPEEVEAFVAKFRTDFKDSVRSFVRGLFSTNADPALVEWIANDMSSAPPAIALSALESAFSYSREITKTLLEIKLPITAINSDNAPTDTASMKRYGVEVVVMHGLGHFLIMEDPKQFNDVLQGVIKRMTK
jgi:pimeloyl-ACP methyl ester carboxylesterase